MGSKTREISTVDQVERPSQDAATQQGPQLSRPVGSTANLAQAGVYLAQAGVYFAQAGVNFAQLAVNFAQTAVKQSGEGEMQVEEIGDHSQVPFGRKLRQKGSGVDMTLHQSGRISTEEEETASNDQETLSPQAHPGPVKGKEMTSKFKASRNDVKTGGPKGKGSRSQTNPQKSRQLGRAANCAQAKGKPFREGQMMKASDHGLSKSRAIQDFSPFETSSADQVERPSHNGDGKQGHRQFKRLCGAEKLAQDAMGSSLEEEMPMKASDGLPKTRGKPNYLARGSETKNTSDQVERPCQDGDAQPGPKQFKRPCRASKLAQAAVKSSREREEPIKASDGLPKISGKPAFIERGLETKVTSTADRGERPSQNVDTLGNPEKHSRSRQKTTAGLFGPGSQVYGQRNPKNGEGEMTMKASDEFSKSSAFIERESVTREASTENQIERSSQDSDAQRHPKHYRRPHELSFRAANFAQAGRKHSGEEETQMKSSERLPKSSGGPDSIGRGSKTKETSTADQVERPSQDVATLERSDIQRRFKQKTTAGLLGPGPLGPALAYSQSNPMKRTAEPGDVQNSNPKKRSTERDDEESQEFFAPYEKVAAESKGPIMHFDQYLEYCKEYREKYLVYVRLLKVLESDKQHFEGLSRYVTIAKAAEDRKKLETIYEAVFKDYKLQYKRFKGMKKTFFILHDDLNLIKQCCKDYEETVASSTENDKTLLKIVPIISNWRTGNVGKKSKYRGSGSGNSSPPPPEEDVEVQSLCREPKTFPRQRLVVTSIPRWRL